jgi:DNA polymerase-3 subunit epsilon
MKLDRAIAFIDLESTSVDPATARIVDFAVVVLAVDGSRSEWQQRFNPGMPIPPDATAVHGIADADVAACPLFALHAKRIQLGLRGKDIAGYNVRGFDLPLLDEELRRCGLKLDLEGVRVIDCCGIYRKKEPRKLADAVRRYAPFFANHHPHDASSDVLATVEVFHGQLAAHPDLAAMTVDELADYSRMSDRREADLAGKLYIDADGDLCFGFGQYANHKVKLHTEYAAWMLRQSFPGSTLDCVRAELRRLEGVPA